MSSVLHKQAVAAEPTATPVYRRSHLAQLESEAIYVMREVAAQRVLKGADFEALAIDCHLQRQRRRGQPQGNAPAVERAQAVAGVGVERQRAVERDFQRAPGNGLESAQRRR